MSYKRPVNKRTHKITDLRQEQRFEKIDNKPAKIRKEMRFAASPRGLAWYKRQLGR